MSQRVLDVAEDFTDDEEAHSVPQNVINKPSTSSQPHSVPFMTQVNRADTSLMLHDSAARLHQYNDSSVFRVAEDDHSDDQYSTVFGAHGETCKNEVYGNSTSDLQEANRGV